MGFDEPIDFDFNQDYPSEFSYMEDLVREAQKQLIHMNQGMFNFPDKGVPTAFDKPKEGEWRFAKRDRIITVLESAQIAYRRSIENWVAQELELLKIDPKIARWVEDSVSIGLAVYYSEEQEATRSQMLIPVTPVKEELGIEVSSAKDASNSGTKEPGKSTKPDEMIPTLSARYSQTLSYTRATERTGIQTGKLPDNEIDKTPD